MARGSWGQSKLLSQKSWAIIRENRYLLFFPSLGFLFSLIPLAIFWVPAAFLAIQDQTVAAIVLLVLGIFANQIVISIASGALVASADHELSGGQSSIGHGVARALARLFPLVGWACIATVVNIIASAIRGNGSGAADVLRNLAAAGILAMWSLITFFVLPFIMLEGNGPISAIKNSFALFKEKWGLQIFGGVRIGGVVALFTILPGIVLVILGVLAIVFGDNAALLSLGILLVVVGVLLFMIGALLLSTMRGIFSVVLFRYAKDGVVEGGFTQEELAGAVRTSK